MCSAASVAGWETCWRRLGRLPYLCSRAGDVSLPKFADHEAAAWSDPIGAWTSAGIEAWIEHRFDSQLGLLPLLDS